MFFCIDDNTLSLLTVTTILFMLNLTIIGIISLLPLFIYTYHKNKINTDDKLNYNNLNFIDNNDFIEPLYEEKEAC